MQTRRISPRGGRPCAVTGNSWIQNPTRAVNYASTEGNSNNTNARLSPIFPSASLRHSNSFSFSTPNMNNQKDLLNHTNHSYLENMETSTKPTCNTTIAADADASGGSLVSRPPPVISPAESDVSSHQNSSGCIIGSDAPVGDYHYPMSDSSNISSMTSDDEPQNDPAFQGATRAKEGLNGITILPDFVDATEPSSARKLRPRRKMTPCYDDDFDKDETEEKNEPNEKDERSFNLVCTLQPKTILSSSIKNTFQQLTNQYHVQEQYQRENVTPINSTQMARNFHEIWKRSDPEALIKYGAHALVQFHQSNGKACQRFLNKCNLTSEVNNNAHKSSFSLAPSRRSLHSKPLSTTTIQNSCDQATSISLLPSETIAKETASSLNKQKPKKKNLKRNNNNSSNNNSSIRIGSRKKQRQNERVALSSRTIKSPQGPIPQQECPSRLAMARDQEYLNSLHCFVRSELLELFCSANDNNRVGLRCVFCGTKKKNNKTKKQHCNSFTTSSSLSNQMTTETHHNPKLTKMSTFYPKSLDDLYRNVCAWQQKHFRTCPYIPKDVRNQYTQLKSQDKTRGKTKYWATSARALGLVDNTNPTTDTVNADTPTTHASTSATTTSPRIDADGIEYSTTEQGGSIKSAIGPGIRFVGYNSNNNHYPNNEDKSSKCKQH